MNWTWKGRAWVYGDDIPNDEGLMPLKLTRAQEYDPAILAKHCFEQVDPDFAKNARPGDFVVAGRNFGFGNPHIQGFLGLKGMGVGLIVESMARGPLRACVNAGVPVLCPVPGIRQSAEPGDDLEVDFRTGRIRNLTKGSELNAESLPEVMQEIIAAGGGVGYMRRRLGLEPPAER